MPPPSVSPAMPVFETAPAGGEAVDLGFAVELAQSDAALDPPVRVFESTRMPFMARGR